MEGFREGIDHELLTKTSTGKVRDKEDSLGGENLCYEQGCGQKAGLGPGHL